MKNLQDKAFIFSSKAHRGQTDDCGKPYIIHPLQVAQIIEQVTDDEELICAAYLHDTLEDTDTTYEDIVKEFGKKIADLVNEVTHEKKEDASGHYFPRLKTKEGIMLKLADRLSNVSRMENWDEKRKEQYLKKTKFWESREDKN